MQRNPIPVRAAAGLLLALLLAGPVASAQRAARSAARGVLVGPHGPFAEALTLESRASGVRLVLVPSAGGRTVFYGREGRNLLWEGTGPDDGGALYDIGPDTANLGPRPAITAGAYDWNAPRPFAVRLRSANEPGINLSASREVTLDPETGEAGFLHRMKNLGDRPASRAFVDRIQVPAGGYVLLPLHARSRFPARWSTRREEGGRPVYESRAPAVEGVQLLDGVLVADTRAPGARVGTDGDAHWIAYVRGRELFVVHFPTFSTGIYAQGGNTAEAAWNADFATLMPLSPEVQLREGKSYDFPTKWMIVTLDAPVTTPAEARAAAAEIPSSPFL